LRIADTDSGDDDDAVADDGTCGAYVIRMAETREKNSCGW